MADVEDIVRFYANIVGDAPYPSTTVALVEHDLPGGHSPGYFALLNTQLPGSSLSWRGDPAAFSGVPEFFIAHELAHVRQWREHGLMFIPRYLAASAAAARAGGDRYHDNPFEVEARAAEESISAG